MKRGLSDENGDGSVVETLSMLQSECRRRGLSVAGPEVLLRERLRAHSAGQAALMKKPRHLSLDGSAREGVEHIPLSMGHHSGAETFLALPHDVIKRALLPYVKCADLFSLAMTCKYLHNDCIGEAQSRSTFIFNNDSRATPMTLHLLCKLVNMTRRVTVLTGRELWEKGTGRNPQFHAWSWKERARRACAILRMDDPGAIDYPFEGETTVAIHSRLSRFDLDLYADVTEYTAAAWTLRGNRRSTERAKAALLFAREQEDAKKAEVALVARYKQDRVSELNRALFGHAVGEITVFAYDAQADDIVVTAIGNVVFKMFNMQDKKKCRTFILKATPSLPTAVKYLTSHSEFYNEYKRHARKGRVIDLALAAAHAHATTDNAPRLAVWLRAFFCMDTSCKGALFDFLLELTPEYIDALVTWIVATSSLPVTVEEICPPTYTKMHAVFLRVNAGVNDNLPPAVHYDIDLAKPHPTLTVECVTPVGHVSTDSWEPNKLFPLGAALKKQPFSSVSWFGLQGMWIEIEKGIPPLIAIINE